MTSKWKKRNILFLFTTLTLFLGCETDTSEISIEEEFVEIGFSLNDIEDETLRQALWKVDQNVTVQKQIGDSDWKEYKLYGTESQLDSEAYTKTAYSLLVVENPFAAKRFFVVKALYNSTEQQKTSFSYLEKRDFSGMIYVHGLDGVSERTEYVQKGKVLSAIYDNEAEQVKNSSLPKTARCHISKSAMSGKDGEQLGCIGGGGWVKQTTHHYTDYYLYRGDNNWEYSNTTYNGSTTEYVWVVSGIRSNMAMANYIRQVFSPGGAGPLPGSYAYRQLMEGNLEIPDRVIKDPSFIGTKAECVYRNLQNKNGNLFKETIGAFIDDPEYNLTLKVGNCPTTDDACTNSSDINNILITIEDINQNSLGIATLILHEGLHAEMHRYVSRFESGVDPNNRARLLQLYAHYKGWAEKYQDEYYNWKQVAHHNYMVENYVKKIAAAVRTIDNNRYPLDYYMAYGWDGLRETGYTAKRLTNEKNTYYANLRQITDANSKICE